MGNKAVRASKNHMWVFERPKHELKCVNCNNLFYTWFSRGKYCSNYCKRIYSKVKKESNVVHQPIKGAWDGIRFEDK